MIKRSHSMPNLKSSIQLLSNRLSKKNKKKNLSIDNFKEFLIDNPAFNVEKIGKSKKYEKNVSFGQYCSLHPNATKQMRRIAIRKFYRNLLLKKY